MPEELREIYRDYQEGKISRRDFIGKAVLVTGSLAAAYSMLGGTATDADAAVVASNDPDILTHNVEYQGKSWSRCRLPGSVRSKRESIAAAVVVIRENQGLTDHIRDVARRVAKEGYVALPRIFYRGKAAR